MSARYWVTATGHLYHEGTPWPDGIRETGRTWHKAPGTDLIEIEDDDARPSLGGQWVDVLVQVTEGVPAVAVRSVVG